MILPEKQHLDHVGDHITANLVFLTCGRRRESEWVISKTRSYKLRLSREGFDHFLRCHHRLAGVVGELIPYGALYVAVALLGAMRAEDLGGDADTRVCARLAGERPYFVGFSIRLAEITNGIRARPGVAADLSVARLYLLGLLAFASAQDDELLDAYRVDM